MTPHPTLKGLRHPTTWSGSRCGFSCELLYTDSRYYPLCIFLVGLVPFRALKVCSFHLELTNTSGEGSTRLTR